ncbi:MAG TPA: type II toxin-antitoxin system VapC family toxin [Acidimicrobiales bacterium]|nr:type II toxin-antitoxin system VapC family toxin [Acidimicrobiales bacterium]
MVLDSSALLPLVTNRPGRRRVIELAMGVDILIPHVADVEVLMSLRDLWLTGQIDQLHLTGAAAELEAMPAPRFGMLGLHQRVLQLRAHLSTFDATYVALAESLELELVTYDRAQADAPGIRCDVILLED